MDTLTSLSWYFSNTLPAIFFTIKMHYSEMERCWGSRFFQHVLHSFNTDFFIARKLLSNVNKQLNKAIGPSSLTAKCSQRGKGIGKTKCWSWVLLYCRKLCSKQEKICTPQRFSITKAPILFTSLNNAPSLLLLQRALSRTRRFFVKHLFTEYLQNTTNLPPRATRSLPRSPLSWQLCQSAPESRPCNEISETRQH